MTCVEIVTSPFDASETLKRFADDRRGAGALASFTGYCRDRSNGAPVEALELEHYPGFTERQIEAIAGNAVAKHGLIDLMIVHRVGRIATGEAIVLVAALSSHRGAAFAAVEEVMDFLKTDAPLWKREAGPNFERWVEPTSEDHERRAKLERSTT